MKQEEQILDALGEVGLDLVDQAEKLRFSQGLWRRILPVAACAVLMVGAGAYAWQSLRISPAEPAMTTQTDSGLVQGAAKEEPRVMLSSQQSEIDLQDPRALNVSLACQALDGLVLEPGEEFSFNDTVGERTEEKGYVAASVFDGDATEIGGGIGQAASMLYCASLKLNLQQVERAGNTYAVDYVPPGLDAAVYWGVTDYRFRNTLEHPVEIRAAVTDGVVSVELWGAEEDAASIVLQTIVTEENIVETFQQFLDEDGNVLQQQSLGITIYKPRP